MATYNHIAYVKDTIESIKRNAKNVPLKLWIQDDGSTDGTVDYLKSINEDFIDVSFNTTNVGAGETINTAISRGEAEFVAIINSDDIWHPNKLEMQLKAYEKGYGDAIFTLVDYINQYGHILENGSGSYTPNTFRTNENWAKKNWLQMVCFGSNCLCTPSFLGLRSALIQVGGYDNRFRQIPDIELWTRLFQTQKPFVLPDKLVHFRLHPENTSQSTKEAQKRHAFEAKMIMKSVFFKMNKDVLAENFSIIEGIETPVFDQIVSLISRAPFYGIQLALELIHENLESKKYESNFTSAGLHKLTGRY